MNKRQKEVLQVLLNDEKRVIRELQKVYRKSRQDCVKRLAALAARTDMENIQTIIYQQKYQTAIKKQLDDILDALATGNYQTISRYLTDCYENSFVGTLYDLQGQGVPLLFPIDQDQAARAIQVDTKLSVGLYNRLGEDVQQLKKSIRLELSRGIAAGDSWGTTANRIAKGMNSPFKTSLNNAMRIARTEGHRIQEQSNYDAALGAKRRGANVKKQWDATLDSRTRDSHRTLHGQICELEDYFEVNGRRALHPGAFGIPSEDIHCRCHMVERASWALGVDETHYLGRTEKMTDAQLSPIASKLNISVQELRKYSDQIIPVKAKSYEDFRRQYNNIWHYESVPEAEET